MLAFVPAKGILAFRICFCGGAAPLAICMATDKALSDFLAGVERRAFKQAVYAVKRDEVALDLVQDAMIRLAEKYGDRPPAEFPMLFQRILQNVMHDYFRREKVRNTWVSLFSSFLPETETDGDADWLDVYRPEAAGEMEASGEEKLERAQVFAIIEEELQKLPLRQREAFLMRYWHDMDVAETAKAMQCSAGSVKTHCSRAVQALAKALKSRGVTL